jgi:seryl-tRNA synthetase
MIDITLIRENPEKVKKGVVAKQLDPGLVDQFLRLDEKRRNLLGEIESLRAKRNEAAKAKDIDKGREIKAKLQKKEPELKEIEEKYKKALWQIPNLPAGDVPVGKDESENKVIRKWGKPTKFDFKPKDHLELGEALDIIDVKRAAKVSGTRFGYLKDDAVLLEFALVNFAIEVLTKEGFTPVIPPVLIKKASMRGMGYLEHGGEEDMYVLEKDNLVLVGTSEQSIGPMHKDEVFDAKDLPKRYVGFSPCFRREAGSYGKDTKGILRVHQFDKVEMFSFCKAESGDDEHEYLLGLEEKFYQALKIPYQVVKMCTGDLGAPAARKYDIEAWMPGQGKYREVTSTSTTTDFQARRLNIKYREGGKVNFVHTLNGTAFAIGRTIIAILENYQQEDGSVVIPKVLRKYIGKDRIS